MQNNKKSSSAPLGEVEPHAQLLERPKNGQLLYKVMRGEDFLYSIIHNYLYFNRVDRYSDSPVADIHDGEQSPVDRKINKDVKFVKAPDYSAENYFDQARARTYACCFSMENSDYIWNNYGNDSKIGKVCVIFEFGKLRAAINEMLKPGNAALEYKGIRCLQIFSVNYGVVQYVEWENHQINREIPILNTYRKDTKFSEEREFRISLSAMGMGQNALNDGNKIQFTDGLPLEFDFETAIANGTIVQILHSPDADSDFLKAELGKLRLVPVRKPAP